MGRTFSIDEQDIEVATWKIADLMFGESAASQQRLEMEERIQAVMANSFQATVKPQGQNLLAVFERLAECIFDSVEKTPSGRPKLCKAAYDWAGYWEFELAVRLGPEFVGCLEQFGFAKAKDYNAGRYDPGESESQLKTYDE